MRGKRWLLLVAVCALCVAAVMAFHLDLIDVVRAAMAEEPPDSAVPQTEQRGEVPAAGELEPQPAEVSEEPEAPVVNIAHVPILLYHAFTGTREGVVNSACVSAETFEEHLIALRNGDYQTVPLSALVDFVYEGTPLPEDPVVLIADDGYLDNLTIAAPLLEKYGACMSVAVIGCSVGKDTYKDTGVTMRPHFSAEEAKPWMDSGVIEIVSHSYDMHQTAERDGAACRRGMYPLPGEDEGTYALALTEDLTKSADQLEQTFGGEAEVLAYPYGHFTEISEEVLQELGFKVSLTLEPGTNKLVRGMPQSLYQMKRNWVSDGMTCQDLLTLLHELKPE